MKTYKITEELTLSIDENTKEVKFHNFENSQIFMCAFNDLIAFQKFFFSGSFYTCPICRLSVKMTERDMENLSLFV